VAVVVGVAATGTAGTDGKGFVAVGAVFPLETARAGLAVVVGGGTGLDRV
jgi:hypothetical protein